MRKTRILRSKQRLKDKQTNPLRTIGIVMVSLTVLFACATTTVFAGALGTAGAVFNYFSRDLPDFTDLERLGQDADASFETTKIFAWGADEDGDGNRDLVLIYEIIDPLGGDRQWIPYSQIPDSVVNGTISIEDKTFWSNQGFDVEGIGRAFYEYVVKGGQIQGGSSITQQVVKNNIIEEERRVVGEEVDLNDYRRKVDELLLSRQISQVYTKEQIMEWYLNTNFYGNLAYGIEAAARVYFNKSASQLTIAESAMLAAIPQSPAFNPIDNPEQAKVRQQLVLASMFREGFIDRETLISAENEELEAQTSIEQRFDIISPHFAFYVRRQLERQFGREQVLRGGLQVYTSLDLTLQSQAECVARAHVARLSGETENLLPADELDRCEALEYLPDQWWNDVGVDRNVDNAAIVMIDPRTAEIKAMVGSLNYWDDSIDGNFNVAVDGLRQPGSSFKPFTYLRALMDGYTAASMYLDVETDFGTSYDGVAYVPQNYDRIFTGPMRMREAIANSFNVPAVEAMTDVGVDRVIRLAHKMGINTLEDPNDYGLSLTLGGGEVRLLDMTYAFSILANRGLMVGAEVPEDRQKLGFRSLDPVSILRVENNRGEVLYEYTERGTERIITEQQAFIMNNMMSDREARCPAFGCPNALELPNDRPAAAKTGTTNEWRDSWTIGYTPQMVTGVWVGNTSNVPMDEVPGSKGAAPIWNALMAWSLKDEPRIDWLAPVGVVQKEVCELNGLLPSEACPKITEYFVEGTEPTLIDNMYQTFRINAANGRLATVGTPDGQVYEKTYIVYPEQALDWARENNKELPPFEYDTVNSINVAVGNAAILEPQPFSFVRGQTLVTGNARHPDFSYFNLSYFATSRPGEVRAITQFSSDQRTNFALGMWDAGILVDGSYTLLLQVFNRDNVIVEETRSVVTVDNTAPFVDIAFPYPNQEFLTDDEFVVIQGQVGDEYAIDQVKFYVDNAGVPFAINTVPPFTEKWNIPGPGCHTFRIVAVDGAGNETRSDEVPVCFIQPDE